MQTTFSVRGIPVAKGSMTAGKTADGRVYVRDQKRPKLIEWQRDIAMAAREAIGAFPPLQGPVRVSATFMLPRPKAHYRANGELRLDAPVYCITKPDEDKLRRALLDALTQAAVFKDDSQVCDGRTSKLYANGAPGAVVTVESIEEVAA